MSETQKTSAPASDIDEGAPDPTTLDSVALSALLSSRVCHDLINPVGAIGSGLEVLDDHEMDGTMRDAAMDLIKSGAQKAIALLSYARLAYGAGGAYGVDVSVEDAKKVLDGIFEHVKADLVWNLPGGMAPKEQVKVLLIIVHAAADTVPRGGSVELNGAFDAFTIRTSGKRLILQDDLTRALSGDAVDIAPKFTPALIAAKILAEVNGSISVSKTEEAIEFAVSFS